MSEQLAMRILYGHVPTIEEARSADSYGRAFISGYAEQSLRYVPFWAWRRRRYLRELLAVCGAGGA